MKVCFDTILLRKQILKQLIEAVQWQVLPNNPQWHKQRFIHNWKTFKTAANISWIGSPASFRESD